MDEQTSLAVQAYRDGYDTARKERDYDPMASDAVCALEEEAWQAARQAPAEVAVPIAWRVRIGDSDRWAYAEDETDADFWGKQSGMKYEKQPLYAAAPTPK